MPPTVTMHAAMRRLASLALTGVLAAGFVSACGANGEGSPACPINDTSSNGATPQPAAG